MLKDLKHSTRQRFVTIDFDYPPRDKEAQIIAHESGVDMETALALAKLGEKVRHLKASGLEEGVSTRLLIYAGPADARTACRRAAPAGSPSASRSPTTSRASAPSTSWSAAIFGEQ